MTAVCGEWSLDGSERPESRLPELDLRRGGPTPPSAASCRSSESREEARGAILSASISSVSAIDSRKSSAKRF